MEFFFGCIRVYWVSVFFSHVYVGMGLGLQVFFQMFLGTYQSVSWIDWERFFFSLHNSCTGMIAIGFHRIFLGSFYRFPYRITFFHELARL